jgi:hypothetical protein
MPALDRRHLTSIVLLALAGTAPVVPCSRYGDVDPKRTVGGADTIVVAAAVEYVEPPDPSSEWTRGIVRFRVTETLKGKAPEDLRLPGRLTDNDDLNDRPVPYDFVRPSGRRGGCYAFLYKQGASYLLLLREREGAPTVEWDPLAPVNEQLRSGNDPWLEWVRKRVGRKR